MKADKFHRKTVNRTTERVSSSHGQSSLNLLIVSFLGEGGWYAMATQ